MECPITRQEIREPVRAADGFVYERAAIEAWLGRSGSGGRSPMTNQPLVDSTLSPVRRELHMERLDHQEPEPQRPEPEPEPEQEHELTPGLRAGSQSLRYGSYISRLRISPRSHLVENLRWSVLTSISLPKFGTYINLLPRSLHAWETWTLLELSAAYIGLNRSRRVRTARQLDKLETSFLVRSIPQCVGERLIIQVADALLHGPRVDWITIVAGHVACCATPLPLGCRRRQGLCRSLQSLAVGALCGYRPACSPQSHGMVGVAHCCRWRHLSHHKRACELKRQPGHAARCYLCSNTWASAFTSMSHCRAVSQE